MADLTSLVSSLSVFFSIFLLAAIAGMISERAGVINVGIDGLMTIGALAFSITGVIMNKITGNVVNSTQIIAIIVAALLGGAFAMLHAFASIKLKANQVVSGTAINILAQGLGLYLATGDFPFVDSSSIKSNYKFISIDQSNVVTLYLIIAVVITAIAGIYFTWTKVGQRHAAVGENPNAIDAAGINVLKYRYWAVFVSGCVAGIAGAFFAVSYVGSTFNGTTQGWGFLALAIMIVGQWRVKFITVSAFVFATFYALGQKLPSLAGGWATNNAQVLMVLPFALSLLTMMAMAKYSKPPKADGIPFDKAKR